MNSAGRSQARLLVLDDDPGVAAVIGLIAEGMNFQVVRTGCPREFFESVNSFSPTHIALDLLMPEMDGVEVLRALANSGCTAEIVITSGTGRRVLDAALRVGLERGLQVSGVLPKPFMPDTLRDLLSARGEAWDMRTGTFQQADFHLDESSLAAALERCDLRMLFQPKVTPDLQLRGFEALMRWKHPVIGEILPARFIPAAEQSGLIHALTAQAFQLAVGWLSQQPCIRPVTVAVNLSVRDIERVELADTLAEMCCTAGIVPEQVILELTETGAMYHPANAMDVLTRLRLKGFRLAIDDFGTGYSSMRQLARLPFSEVKIDKGFVSTALRSSESLTIVRTIIDLAHNLGLEAVAEGVESQATLDLLMDLGCDQLQGYYIARPMEADGASDWLADLAPDGSVTVAGLGAPS